MEMTGGYRKHKEEYNPVYERIQEAKNKKMGMGYKASHFSKFTDPKSDLHKEIFSSPSSTKTTLTALKKAALGFTIFTMIIGYLLYLQNKEAKKSYFEFEGENKVSL